MCAGCLSPVFTPHPDTPTLPLPPSPSHASCFARPTADDLVAEVVRCAAGELHAVAAAVGAMASQEAIKLVTRQYVPVGGTLIYNAMACTTSVFTF